jgi:SOUL heme-binding protein
MLATLREGVEIRRYAPRLAAETEAAGTAVEARNAAFRILFAYITGGNAVGEKIAMTAPVAAGRRAETISMTTPVESAPDAGGVRMRFLLPARYTATTAPRPTDARVRLVPIPDETMAILRFSGNRADPELARRMAALRAALAATSWRPVGEPVTMFYDAPFTLPFLRRNEAAIRVDRSGVAGP